MTGDISNFRKRFFGGFNRDDVVDFITHMAWERNELEAARDKAIQETHALAAEIESLRREIGEEKRMLSEDRIKKEAVFETAGDTFARLGSAFDELRGRIEAAGINLRAEMKNTSDVAADLTEMLSEAVVRFRALYDAFGLENSGVGGTSGTYETYGTYEAAETYGNAETYGTAETYETYGTDVTDGNP